MFFLLIVFGCNNTIEKKVIDESKIEVQQINLEKIDLPNLGLVPKGCCFVDSFLVVYNAQVNDSIISVYKDREMVVSFGKIGNGSGEMNMPRFVGKGRTINRYLPIMTGSEYRLYDFQDSNFSEGTMKYLTEKMPEENMLANYVLYNDDSLMVLNVTGDYQLLFYDKNNDNSRAVSFIDDKFLGDGVFDMVYATTVFGASYNCNGKYIVIAYYRQKMIDIVSMSGELLKRLVFNNYDINKNKFHSLGDGNVQVDNDVIRFFTSIMVSDDFFYVVCQEDTEEMNNNGKTKTKLYKLDYDGNLLNIYQMDRKVTFGVVKGNELFVIGFHTIEDAEIYHTEL